MLYLLMINTTIIIPTGDTIFQALFVYVVATYRYYVGSEARDGVEDMGDLTDPTPSYGYIQIILF